MNGVRFVAKDIPADRLYSAVNSGGGVIGCIKCHSPGRYWATFYGLPSELCNSVQEAKDWLIVEAMKARMTK